MELSEKNYDCAGKYFYCANARCKFGIAQYLKNSRYYCMTLDGNSSTWNKYTDKKKLNVLELDEKNTRLLIKLSSLLKENFWKYYKYYISKNKDFKGEGIDNDEINRRLIYFDSKINKDDRLFKMKYPYYCYEDKMIFKIVKDKRIINMDYKVKNTTRIDFFNTFLTIELAYERNKSTKKGFNVETKKETVFLVTTVNSEINEKMFPNEIPVKVLENSNDEYFLMSEETIRMFNRIIKMSGQTFTLFYKLEKLEKEFDSLSMEYDTIPLIKLSDVRNDNDLKILLKCVGKIFYNTEFRY